MWRGQAGGAGVTLLFIRVPLIASVVEKFVKAIDERITCLVTDAGKEWQGIPWLTEEYGFVWKRKNVMLTGHGAMARLDRTVRTLRWYMFLI